MKAIVGIDPQGCYKPALCLLAKLRFAKSEVVLLSTVDAVLPFAPSEGDGGMQAEYSKVIHNLCLSALDAAVDEACARGLHAKARLAYGAPGKVLVEEAEAQKADLVAVRATHHGLWSSSFLGSVSRSLAISCAASVLVAKDDRATPPLLNLVFATDHSEYCNRALDRFLALGPAGIRHIHVVSAWDVNDREAEILAKNLPALGGMADSWIEDQVEAKNAEVVAKLGQAGYSASSAAVRGDADDAIRQAMRDTKADLLVLGAQGHGFFERALAGSVALHQVVAEPYPVLIVRA